MEGLCRPVSYYGRVSGAMNKQALYEADRNQLSDIVPLSTPFSVSIDVASVCNFKCKYCAQSLGAGFDKRHFKRKIMNYDLFCRIIDQLSDFESKIKKIHLFRNGESFCNPRLVDMIRYTAAKNVCESININTNAALLTNELSLQLAESGLSTLCVSLQGLSSKKYKEICNTEINFEQLYSELVFFYENKRDCKLFIKIIDIALEDGEEEQFYKKFGAIADRVYIESAVPVYESIHYSDILKKQNVTRHGEFVYKPDVCQLVFYYLHILANGDVHPCSSIEFPLPIWNIEEKTLKQIWESEERANFLKLHLMKRRRENIVCSKCQRLYQEYQAKDNLDPYADEILQRVDKLGGIV